MGSETEMRQKRKGGRGGHRKGISGASRGELGIMSYLS